MTWFPVYEKMDQKTFLMIGGGTVAARKVNRLRQYFAADQGGTVRIRLLAPETEIAVDAVCTEAAEELKPVTDMPIYVEWIPRAYVSGDETLGDYVIAATDSKELNAEIARRCHRQQIPVNVVDDTSLCTWLFPSLVRRGDLMIGISTGGASPAYAGQLRRQLEETVPENIDLILKRMGEIRQVLPDFASQQKHRSRILSRVLSGMLEGEVSPELSAEKLIRLYISGKGQDLDIS